MQGGTERARLRDAFLPRVGRNILRWGLLGLGAGLVLGVIAGLLFTNPGGFGFWMAVIAPGIFLGGVCAFMAGIASLESPQPGNEPSERDDPLDDESATVVEHTDPIPRTAERDTTTDEPMGG